MDINSLLSNDPPRSAPMATVPSPRKRLPRNLSGSSKRATTGSPLARPSVPPTNIPPHIASASPVRRSAASSPLVSPSAGVLPATSPPRVTEHSRQSSTPSMDTLAEVAAMQNHQPQRSAPPSLRSKDSYEAQLSPSTIYPIVQQPASQTSSRTPLDISMSEAPRIAVRTDYSGSSLSPEMQSTAKQLASALQQSPQKYNLHSELVKFLHKAFVDHVYPPLSPDHQGDPQTFDLLQDLRMARESMDKMFAMGEDLWEEWIQDESMLANTVDEKISVMEKCSKAVTEEYGSVKLWVVFGQWLYHTYRLYQDTSGRSVVSEDEREVGCEIFSWKVVLDTWSTGAERTMFKIHDSHLVWNQYIELSIQELQQAPSTDEVTNIRTLFEGRLQTPHRDWDGTFQLFSTFVSTFMSNDYEQIMVISKHNSKSAKLQWEARESMENELLRSQEMGDQRAEYSAFANYVLWERTPEKQKRLSFQLTNALYERAELRFAADQNLWEDHALYMLEQGHANRSSQSSLPLLDRATRHCPWSGSLWGQYLLSSEREGKSFHETEDIKHKATNTGLLDFGGTEQVIKVHTAWCTYLRRRAFQADSTDEDLDVAEMGIRSSIENLQELAAKSSGDGKSFDPLFRLERIYIRFLSQSGSWDTARETFRGLISKHGDSWEFWLRFYIWEMSCSANFTQREKAEDGTITSSTPAPHYATAVLRQALERETLDWPERILSAYVTHCEDYEDAEELQMAMIEVKRMEMQIAARRAAESEAAAASTAAAEPDGSGIESTSQTLVVDLGVDTSVSSKRKRGENDMIDSGPQKKTKADSVYGKPGGSSRVSEKQLKRDRENATILVQNLPNTTSELKVRQFFRDCGEINNLKLVHSDGTSAVIEFDEKEAALFAQTRDGKDLEGQKIRIQPGSGSTIFVSNFPPTADEDYIRGLFEQYGEIVDVRFPSLKYNTHRRFCYVQFKLNLEAQAATDQDGHEVDENLKLIAKISNPAVKQNRSGAMEEGREVYCKNLHWSATEDDVKTLFSRHGEVESVRIPRNLNGKSKGFCFVVFQSEEEANAATEMNGHTFMSRDLQIEISSKSGTKRQATTVFPQQGSKGDSVADTNGAAQSPSAMSTTSSHTEHPSDDRKDRTIALMNVPDTINDSRIRRIAEKYGDLVKLSLRPDHQGAILEYRDTNAAGKASLGLEGFEFVPGRGLRVGTVAEMFKERAEVKSSKIQIGKPKNDTINSHPSTSQPSAPIRRPGQQTGRRGGLGQKKGPGFKTSEKKDGTDGESPSSAAGKSNDDFRQYLAKK